MTTIAHISDLHLLEERSEERDLASRLRLTYLSFGRLQSAARRRVRLARALDAAWQARADHLVITGDLTEDGVDEQFQVLGRVLRESPWPAHRVTLVPGNHDAYADAAAFSRALSGPLACYEPTSAPGSVTRVGNAAIVAVSTSIHQSAPRAAGRIGEAQLARLERILEDPALADRTVVLAQHHPPLLRAGVLEWVDGLHDRVEQRTLLSRHRHAHVLCGHAHRAEDHRLPGEESARVFLTHAVIEHAHPVRLYEAWRGKLRPLEPAVERQAARRALAHALAADGGLEH